MRRRKYRYLMLIVILLSIGVGYAFLTKDLKINGTVHINDSDWNVHFANYQKTNNSTITPTSGNEPVIVGVNTHEISYTVNFNEPGDVYEFTVDVVNGGTLDATVISLDTTIKEGSDVLPNMPSYLNYSLKYNNGNEFIVPHHLAAGVSEKILVRVEFKKDITVSQYEEIVGKNFQITTKIVYVQGDGSNLEHYLYTIDPLYYFYVDQEMPEEADVFDNYQDVESDVFLRHTMNGNIITKTDIGYIKDGIVYYVPTYVPDNLDQYDRTVLILMKIVGNNASCEFNIGNLVTCSDFVTAYAYNDMLIRGEDYSCQASDLFSFCFHN